MVRLDTQGAQKSRGKRRNVVEVAAGLNSGMVTMQTRCDRCKDPNAGPVHTVTVSQYFQLEGGRSAMGRQSGTWTRLSPSCILHGCLGFRT